MSVTLDSQTIRTLVSPAGGAPLVQALYLRQYHKTLVRLTQLHEQLAAEAPELVARTGFAQAFAALRSAPAATQKTTLNSPAACFWLDVAWNLVRRQSHLRFPEMHAQTHLADFGRFALAAALLSGGGFACTTLTDINGRVALPGAGIYLELPERRAYERLHLQTREGCLTARSPDAPVTESLALTSQSVPLIAERFELNAIDQDLRLAGRTQLSYETLGLESLIKWRAVLEQSWQWISACTPLLAEEMVIGLRAFVPVLSQAIAVHVSASFREAPGLIALSWTLDASVLVEALVHEYHHQKLNALLNLDPLLAGPASEAIYYSPWRDDPRPLLGVLHGAYVFQAVLEFWQRFFAAGAPLLHAERVRQRLHLIASQTQTALACLRQQAQFSPLGSALLEALEANLAHCCATLPQPEGGVQARLAAAQAAHRARWEAAHAQHTAVAVRTAGNSIPPPDADRQDADSESEKLAARALAWLGLSATFAADLKNLGASADPLLQAVLAAHHERGLSALAPVLDESAPGESLMLDLLGGHVAYVKDDYVRAAEFYRSCAACAPDNPYFRQCLAFALRHLGRWRDAELLLTSPGEAARAGAKIFLNESSNGRNTGNPI